MYDRATVIDLIDRALDTDPFCPVCDAPTKIRDEDGRIYLVCSAAVAPHGLVARIGAALLPHIDELVVDLGGARAA